MWVRWELGDAGVGSRCWWALPRPLHFPAWGLTTARPRVTTLQEAAILKAWEALQTAKIEKDAATQIKKAFDERFLGTWHCIVGRNYGVSITHETK